MNKKFPIIFLIFIFCVTFLFSQEKYHNLTSIVTDDAQLFTPSQFEELSIKLTQFEKKTSNQLVVLTIPSLEGLTIEQYANEVFNKNDLGLFDIDNGILLLYSKQERKVRLEIGYGLEPVITDALSKRIIEKTMIPAFKEGNNYEGINLATNQIIEFIDDPILAGEFNNYPKLGSEEFINKEKSEMSWFAYIFIFLFSSAFLFFGCYMFNMMYKQLLEVFTGFFTGKLSIFHFIIFFISCTFPVIILLPFIIVPLFFIYILFRDFISLDIEFYFNSLDDIVIAIIVISILIIIVFILPILITLYRILILKRKFFKVNWFVSSTGYIYRTFSSSGSSSSLSSFDNSSSSSYSSSFSSSSSSSSSGGSSFSGGGGSSGGGGASGSW